MTDFNTTATAGWGWFRKFIATNPLTGFWIGFALGAVTLGWWLGRLKIPF